MEIDSNIPGAHSISANIRPSNNLESLVVVSHEIRSQMRFPRVDRRFLHRRVYPLNVLLPLEKEKSKNAENV